ncbi:polysaccharide lyase beta-sandwich domain-containing protein [Cnuibacter physcomitrellae]|uniref:polysaccharide lyase family 8 super-sandwich domain-containing protein n=1 Tax=Cnuibacter physcomitrellae TaxID=1619308 RepID=UPI002175952A|nr:polysaccharide lyase family 8 super-sandwich domain-containing protein [Cnuibacter physcomitrellae]MCS5497448.1 polysaccharide lyase beta-sandwich domain-containing protein [Cnuibacter physcomitrellae]
MFRSSPRKATTSTVALAMLTGALVLTPSGAYAQPTPSSASVVLGTTAAEEFDALRERYATMVAGGSSFDASDSDIAARVAGITAAGQQYWDSMKKTADRNRLWDDSPFGNDSASVTRTYQHLRAMALAYSTAGSGLQGDSQLKADLLSGLDWMNSNVYYDGATMYQNWWHWQIGAPLALNDIVALVYNDLTSTQVSSYMAAITYAQPTVTMTGANRLWESQVIAISGINGADATRIAAGRDGLSALFPYVTSGDGFYQDGSFVQHNYYAYNGGYGASLLAGIADLMYLLDGSTWDVVDPNSAHTIQWVYDAFEPFVYKGNLMDMVRGREVSRYGVQDDDAAVSVLSSIIRLSSVSPATDALAFKSMIKAWLATDSDTTFLSSVPIDLIVAAKAILADSSVPSRGELVTHRQYTGIDRTVHLRPGFGFGISMASSRIGAFESINSENAKGWHTGDGMTYLYNDDLSQFNGDFWPTVDSFRLPGTTVLKGTTQPANSRTDRSWVGGASILGQYGVTGMELHPVGSGLEGKKSWFMFDDEIVALGAGITSTDGIGTETIVENRKLNAAGDNALTVNGVTKPTNTGWAESAAGVDTVHLSGNVPGSDIGYYFPGGATVNGLREQRTGNWKQLNSSSEWANTTPVMNSFLSLALDHGTNPTDAGYSYVLLPNRTSAEVSSYAAAPDISILENSGSVQAVRENGLNVTGINFWKDEPTSAAGVTSDKKASVMMSQTSSSIDLSIADPTQKNTGQIYLSLDTAATGLVSKDPQVTVLQYTPTVKLKVDVHGAGGKDFNVTFSLDGAQQANPAPIAVPAAYEAETLPINALSDSVTRSNDGSASGGKKLGVNNNAVGDYVEFSVDVPQAGTYDLGARVYRASNSGIYQLSINGADVGGPQDLFWAGGASQKDVSFGSAAFPAPGSYLVRLTTTGKNSSASGYKVLLDYLTLTPTAGG